MGNFNLNTDHLRLLNKYENHELEHFTASDEEQRIFGEVIDMAEELCEKMDAYENIGDDLVLWFYNEYKKATSK